MKTTIKDIARECNVSTATVSLALAGKEGRVSKSTVQRILETANKLNYSPNLSASNLAKGVSKYIGIVFNDVRNSHIAELFMVINHILQRRGYSLICHILDDTSESTLESLINQVVSENICGLIWTKPYCPNNEKENDLFRRFMKKLDIPVFTMGDYGLDCLGVNVCFDYEKAGYMATQYLINMGHRKIGCLAGQKNYEVSIQRLNGYIYALKDADIEFDEKLIYYGNYQIESGREALPYLKGKGVTAIFAQNDEMAFGICGAARQYGIKIPQNLSIIGCDNVPFDEVLEVPLSTVRVPAREMAEYIAENLCDEIENHIFTVRETVMYSPDLFLRGSVMRINNQ